MNKLFDFLSNFLFKRKENQDYICRKCPLQGMTAQDYNLYKNKEKIRKYCEKNNGNNIQAEIRFINNKANCIIKKENKIEQ